MQETLASLEHKKEQCTQDLKNQDSNINRARKAIENVKKDFPNIDSEIQQTKSKFDQIDPQKLEQEIAQLQDDHLNLKKRINTQIELMFEKTESWHNELLQKKQTLSANKEAIEQSIAELDELKNKDIQKTVKEVSQNFSNIFSTLLPNVDCFLKSEFDQVTK